MSKHLKITLPYPPSANIYWRHRVAFKGRKPYVQTYISPDAKSYKNHVQIIALQSRIKPIEGEVILRLDVYRPRKSGDLSNRIKVLEDALIGLAYADDKQVCELHVRRFDDAKNPRVEVMIEPRAKESNEA
jgi:crossover junction endodeoxyribonuclease RusA